MHRELSSLLKIYCLILGFLLSFPTFLLAQSDIEVSKLRIVQLTLVNADTDEDISSLKNGDVLNLSELPTENLNVRATVSTLPIDRVIFGLNTAVRYRNETAPPYALAGDTFGDYLAWRPRLGRNTITVTAYSKGREGVPLSITFTVTKTPSLAKKESVVKIEKNPKSPPLSESLEPSTNRAQLGQILPSRPIPPAPLIEVPPESDPPPLFKTPEKKPEEKPSRCVAIPKQGTDSVTIICQHHVEQAEIAWVSHNFSPLESCPFYNALSPLVADCNVGKLSPDASGKVSLSVVVESHSGERKSIPVELSR